MQRRTALILGVLLFAPALAPAQTWMDRDGIWSDGFNWTGGPPVSGIFTRLDFGISAPGERWRATNDITNPFDLSTINIGGTQPVVIDGGALRFSDQSPNINYSGTSSAEIANAIMLSSRTFVTVGNGGSLLLSRSVGDAGGIDKFGGGTLVLGNANSYLGDTSVQAGILRLENVGALNHRARFSCTAGALLS